MDSKQTLRIVRCQSRKRVNIDAAHVSEAFGGVDNQCRLVGTAKELGSSHSRVAKVEAVDATVSTELLVRSLLAVGASRQEVSRIIGRKTAVPAAKTIVGSGSCGSFWPTVETR